MLVRGQEVERIDRDLTLSNGLAWTADGRTLVEAMILRSNASSAAAARSRRRAPTSRYDVPCLDEASEALTHASSTPYRIYTRSPGDNLRWAATARSLAALAALAP